MKRKTLKNSNIDGATKNVPDIKFAGTPDLWKLLCKAYSEEEGWMKSTKAMMVPGAGCLVQVTTQQTNPDGSYVIAEAITFFPRVSIQYNLGIYSLISHEELAAVECARQLEAI